MSDILQVHSYDTIFQLYIMKQSLHSDAGKHSQVSAFVTEQTTR